IGCVGNIRISVNMHLGYQSVIKFEHTAKTVSIIGSTIFKFPTLRSFDDNRISSNYVIIVLEIMEYVNQAPAKASRERLKSIQAF
ncbi:MAG TPA: hypothetical protein VL727_19160, partial [Puia sp.]|nr:hypothetical protein [Puia sp.]